MPMRIARNLLAGAAAGAAFAVLPIEIAQIRGGWDRLVAVPAAIAQSAPADSAETKAFEASKELGTVEAWQAFLKSFPTGFRADLARAYLAKLQQSQPTTAGQAAPAPAVAGAGAAAASGVVRIDPKVIAVGKWPERIAFDGRSLWVSESGQRSIAAVDPQSRAVTQRLQVGRLPVDVSVSAKGDVYVLAETDNMVHAIASGEGRAGEFTPVPGCADIMAYADEHLWVLSNLNCSAPSVLTRVSTNNGRTRKVADLPGGGSDLTAAHGVIYVAHATSAGRPAFVSVVDPSTGTAATTPAMPVHHPRLTANASAVFVVGAPLDQSSGVIQKLDAGRAAFVAERRLPEPVSTVTATDNYVVAVGRRGSIFVMAASDLTPLRHVVTSGPPLKANDVVAIGDTLFVVSSGGNENTAENILVAVDGWSRGLPFGTPAIPVVARIPRPSPPATITPTQTSKPPLKCAENYKLVRGECVLLQNCGANAYRSPEGDCYCNKSFTMVNGRCVASQQAQPKPPPKPQPVRDNCPGDSVLKNGKCVKEQEPDLKPPVKCTGGQLYSLSLQRCACQDGLKWNGQRCTL